MSSWIRLGGAMLLVAYCAVAGAQAFPSKPMRIIVAFPAGGPIDIVARMLSPKVGELLGQQALVENRVGANGIIGADHVAKSPPDGYTMILSSPSSIAISPAVYPKMPFDTLRDLVMVTLVTTTPELLVVPPLGAGQVGEGVGRAGESASGPVESRFDRQWGSAASRARTAQDGVED